MCVLLNLRSSQSASTSSCILRQSVRSWVRNRFLASCWVMVEPPCETPRRSTLAAAARASPMGSIRSEEHTSELQSQSNLVCRLLLEKKKKIQNFFINLKEKKKKKLIQ